MPATPQMIHTKKECVAKLPNVRCTLSNLPVVDTPILITEKPSYKQYPFLAMASAEATPGSHFIVSLTNCLANRYKLSNRGPSLVLLINSIKIVNFGSARGAIFRWLSLPHGVQIRRISSLNLSNLLIFFPYLFVPSYIGSNLPFLDLRKLN